MLNKKTVEDIDVAGKKVLVRCDFNVPMEDGKITDDNRIVGALPTIKYLLSKQAKVILCSHLGRPKGEFNLKYSLAPVAARLSELLGVEVTLAKDVVGEDAQAKAAALGNGEVLLLENVRFHKEPRRNIRKRRIRDRAPRTRLHRGGRRLSARRVRISYRKRDIRHG